MGAQSVRVKHVAPGNPGTPWAVGRIVDTDVTLATALSNNRAAACASRARYTRVNRCDTQSTPVSANKADVSAGAPAKCTHASRCQMPALRGALSSDGQTVRAHNSPDGSCGMPASLSVGVGTKRSMDSTCLSAIDVTASHAAPTLSPAANW